MRIAAPPISMLATLAALAALAIGGCRAPTQALITVDGDPEVRARATFLQITVFPGRREQGSPTHVLQAQLRRPDGSLPDVSLPTIIPLVPGSLRAAPFTVLAEAFERSISEPPLVSGFVTTSFIDRATIRIPIYLYDACIGTECDPTLTCREGRCVTPDVDPLEEPVLAFDAQPLFCGSDDCYEHPRPGPAIYDVCLPPDGPALAVGSRGVIERRADGTWDILQRTPNLNAIQCSPGGRAIAAGEGGKVIERIATGEWIPVELGTTTDIVALDGPPHDLWAQGADGTLFRRLDGAWSSIAPPDGARVVRLAVAHDGAAVWIGTARTDTGLVQIFSRAAADVAWSEIVLPSPGALDVMTSAGGLLLVQQDGSFLSHDGATWRTEPLTACPIGFIHLSTLSGGPDGTAIGGGARGGAFLRSPDGAWTCQATRSGQLIDGAAVVDPASADPTVRGMLVARDGQIARWDGTSIWREDVGLFQGTVIAIAHEVDHRFVAVGGGPEAFVVERLGESGLWRKRSVFGYDESLGTTLRAVAIDGSTVVAVGDAGLIVERDEDGVYHVGSPASGPSLRAVDAHRGRVVAVGEGGELLERGAEGWAPLAPRAPGDPDLDSVTITDDGAVWVGAGAAAGADRCTGSFPLLRLRAGAWEELARFPCAVGALARASAGGVWIGADGVHLYDGTQIARADVERLTAPVLGLWSDDEGVLRAGRNGVAMRMMRDDLPYVVPVNTGRAQAFALGPSYAIIGGIGGRLQRVFVAE